MSPVDDDKPVTKVRGFFHGIGEVGAFIGECAVAVFELCVGKWPQPAGARRKPKPPNEGMSPVEKIAPYPADD